MAHTHEFDCKVCGAHLDSRQDLDRHNREKHPTASKNSQSASSSNRPSNQSQESQR
jgi:hypothetical protein